MSTGAAVGSGPRGVNRATRVEEPAGRRDDDPGQVNRPAEAARRYLDRE
jgi:hypothetical protein